MTISTFYSRPIINTVGFLLPLKIREIKKRNQNTIFIVFSNHLFYGIFGLKYMIKLNDNEFLSCDWNICKIIISRIFCDNLSLGKKDCVFAEITFDGLLCRKGLLISNICNDIFKSIYDGAIIMVQTINSLNDFHLNKGNSVNFETSLWKNYHQSRYRNH